MEEEASLQELKQLHQTFLVSTVLKVLHTSPNPDTIQSHLVHLQQGVFLIGPPPKNSTGCFFLTGTPPKSSKYKKVNQG